MLRHHRQGVGRMVPHHLKDRWILRHRLAELMGEVPRMPVDRDPLELMAMAFHQFGDAGVEALVAAPLAQIAEMGRQPHPALHGQGGGGLEVAAEGERRP